MIELVFETRSYENDNKERLKKYDKEFKKGKNDNDKK
jgi:hypothetical protein